MQITENIFIGAYNARKSLSSVDFLKASEVKNSIISDKAAKAIQEIKQQSSKSATISLSDESKAFLCSEEGYNKMKKDVENLYVKNALQQKELMQNNENDSFWSNTGNQWLVFSESLYQNGFYDNMTDEEVKEIETTLAKITAGMDHVSRTQYNTGIEFSDLYGHGANFFMSSNEVNLELESATAALRYFKEKYVNTDQKEEFNKLIDTFYSHNSQIIEGYKSPLESFNKAVYNMYSGKYQNSAINNKYAVGMKQEYSNIDISVYLGGVTHSNKEKESYQKEITSLLNNLRINGYNSEEVWNEIKETFLDYETNNGEDKKIREYVELQIQHTFSRMKGYWKDLLSN